MSTKIEAYKAILELVPETIRIDKVSMASKSFVNESGEHTYNFIAKIIAPIKISNVTVDENDCVRIAMFAKRKLKRFGGPSATKVVRWEDPKGKSGRFDFSSHLSPENIISINVESGIVTIIAKAHGTFF